MNETTINREIKHHGLNAWIADQTASGFMVEQVAYDTISKCKCIVADEITNNRQLLNWLGY